MDPQGCFSPPIISHLANQTNVITSFAKSFPDYPRLIPTTYEMRLRDTIAFGNNTTDIDKDTASKEAFSSSTFSNSNNSMRYPSATTRKSGPSMTPEFHTEDNNPANCEPADLSMRSSGGLCETAQQQPTNTRLLREILQGKKHDDLDSAEDMMENDETVSNHASLSVEDDSGGEDLVSKSDAGEVDNDSDRSGVIRQAGTCDGESQHRMDTGAVSGMRVPSNGASSENSEPSPRSRKGSKRKQVYPQQMDNSGHPSPDKDVMRQQLTMMQEQIDVLQERYSSIFDEDEVSKLASHKNSQKRKFRGDESDAATGNESVPHFGGGVRRMNDRLAALISTEIHQKISPIVASVINKYLHSDGSKEDQSAEPQQQQPVVPKPRSKTASPMEDLSLPAPVIKKTPIEKPKQPLNVNNDVHLPGKNFGNMYMNFPARPFFGNENKLGNDFINLSVAAAMAGAGAPTMFNPNFQHFMRPGFFPAEQTEAIPLIVSSQKKKRHKVTDTRITPRIMSKTMIQKEESQDGRKFMQCSPGPMNTMLGFNGGGHPFLGRPMESLQSLNHSDFSPFHPSMDNGRYALTTPPFFNRINMDRRETSSPLGGSAGSLADNDEVSLDASDLDSTDMSVSGRPSATNFSRADSLSYPLSSTLTPMHLRKAKLIFFFTRYPNSATLKTFFPDIKFNKNNTAQLVKWFSNFREFFYIQMEKFAKQALADGIHNPDEIEVAKDSELYRALNLHYNRNNHIDVPDAFRDVVEETLKEFFRALQTHRDQEPSWKKAIYKVINRMDDVIPDYFRLPHFLEQLE